MKALHFKNILFICLIIMSLKVLSQDRKAKYKIRTIAFYNVENLFDTINDPKKFDDDRTPTGKDHYTSKIYWNKINHMARVISEIGAKKAKNSPTLIGLSEVETRGVVQDLIQNI